MLLYQMSQWMDERQQLQRELRADVTADASYALQHQIQELEERLYSQARQWMSAYQSPSAVAMPGIPYEPPVLLDPESDLQ